MGHLVLQAPMLLLIFYSGLVSARDCSRKMIKLCVRDKHSQTNFRNHPQLLEANLQTATLTLLLWISKPSSIALLIWTFFCDLQHSTLSCFTGYFNSTLNPLIYVMTNHDFKASHNILRGKGLFQASATFWITTCGSFVKRFHRSPVHFGQIKDLWG